MKKFRHKKCPATIGFRQSGQAVIVFCGRWNCPECSKRLARKWAIRVYFHIEQKSQENDIVWHFLTLTLGSAYTDASHGYSALKKLWNSLRMYISRKKGKFQYVAFVEGQEKRGNMPHFHIILSVIPPDCQNKAGKVVKHRVHDFAVARGFGHQAKLELVSSRRAAWYVSKYASKGSPHVPKGFRHVRASRGWYRPPQKSPLIVPSALEDVATFVARVSTRTGIDAETIYERYTAITGEFEALQHKGDS